ncbi:Arm DNA-binding domain-containing protein [Bordetella hinzii]|uniref:Arm DNA-binding domain-containing protein n=1 Tax=Bordetella hinzii TaxID=103855 RepID=UPI0039FDD3BF
MATLAKLADTAIRTAKGRDKPYKMADGGGLYILVKPDGTRYWRYNYRHADKDRTMAFGVYPEVTAKAARERHAAARAARRWRGPDGRTQAGAARNQGRRG